MQLLYSYKFYQNNAEADGYVTARQLREMATNGLLFPRSLINIPDESERRVSRWYWAEDFVDLAFDVSPDLDRLIACLSCGTIISHDAITCPQCHYNREQEVVNLQLLSDASPALVEGAAGKTKIPWLLLVSLLLISLIMVLCCGGLEHIGNR